MINYRTVKTKTCKDCGQEFSISEKELDYYLSNGLHEPVRCKSCREKAKNKKILDKFNGFINKWIIHDDEKYLHSDTPIKILKIENNEVFYKTVLDKEYSIPEKYLSLNWRAIENQISDFYHVITITDTEKQADIVYYKKSKIDSSNSSPTIFMKEEEMKEEDLYQYIDKLRSVNELLNRKFVVECLD